MSSNNRSFLDLISHPDHDRRMRVAIISPYATVVPHFETELEIAQQHLDRGDSVAVLSCMGQLDNCDFNRDRDSDACLNCKGRREMGFEYLESHRGELELVSIGEVELSRRKSTAGPFTTSGEPIQLEFEQLDDLINYTVEGFDLGYAALSSLISICRDPEPDLAEHRELLARFIRSAWSTYQFTLNYVQNETPDRVYVFNGRFAAMRAVLRACQKSKVDCWLHERGCDLQHFDFSKNHLLHEIEHNSRVIHECWQSGSLDDLPDSSGLATDRATLGSRWFEDRVNRVEKNWHSFVKAQESGRLPEDLDRNIRNVALFCSSDDEFVAVGDCWTNALYPNQVAAIARIAGDLLGNSPQTKIYLRVHPNLNQVDNQRKRDMLALDFPNLSIIAPDAKIDTYALMAACDTTVSFGSTVGIEAVFWDRPSVLLGPSMYRNLGGTYQPATHQETIELLSNDLPCLDKTGALMYGYWLQVRGYGYQYFEATGLFEGNFKGEVLYNRPRKKGFKTRILARLAQRQVKG